MQFTKLAIVTVTERQFKVVDESDLDFNNVVLKDLSWGLWSRFDLEVGLNRQQRAVQKHVDKALENNCTHVLFKRGNK
jgi:hypothetical protein